MRKHFFAWQKAAFLAGLVITLNIVAIGQNVGVGTTAPTVKLQVNDHFNADSSYLKLVTRSENQPPAGSRAAGIIFQHSIGDFGFKIESLESSEISNTRPRGLYFKGSNGDAYANTWLFIDRFQGNIGVWTNRTDRPLTIRGNGSNDLISLQRNSDSSTRWHVKLSGEGNSNLNFTETGVAENRLYLAAGGNVGIGTSTPEHPLQIATGPGVYTAALSILPSTAEFSRRAEIRLDDWAILQDISGGGSKDFAIYQQSSGEHRFSIATGGNVGIGNLFPEASAQLEVKSNNKGLLIPRMTSEERDGIAAPATGLMVFVTTDSSFYFREANAWRKLSGDGENWRMNGNAKVTGKFIGTLDTAAFRLRTRNVERITIDSTGYIGINNQKPATGIHLVDDGRGESDIFIEYNNNELSLPTLYLGKSRGTPAAKVAIDSSKALGQVLYTGYDGTLNTSAAAIVAFAEGDFSVAAKRKASLRFATNDGSNFRTRMMIGANGNVGIATNKTDRPLTIKGNATNDLISLQRNSDSTTRWHLKLSGAGNSDLNFTETGVGENRLYLAAGGNVGIGTATPGAKLDVATSMRVISTNGSFNVHPFFTPGLSTALLATFDGLVNGPQMRFESTAPGWMDIGLNGIGDFVVEGNDDARLTVTVSGNVGIGTAPAAKLDVNGNIKITDGTQGANKVLTSNASGVASWQNLPSAGSGFKVTQAAPQIIPTTATTQVTWPVEVYDDANAFTANAYTVPVSGLYHFDVKVNWNNVGAAGSPFTGLTLRKNGVEAAFSAQNIPAGVTNVITVNINADLKLVAGDVMTVTAQQNTGVNLGFAGGEYLIFFSGHRVY